jgi:glycine/D-amino acid oxidase-like deaminating enzyme
MLSYWEKESYLRYDVIIVGAGITGLSSAISLLEKKPELNILVLEKSIFPSGASTKNAGFACFGSLTELLSDIDIMGQVECLALVKKRWYGLQKLRSRFTDAELGYESLGGFELLRDSQLHYLDNLDSINKILYPIFNENVFSDVSGKIQDFGFNIKSFSGMVFNHLEGQIDTGKTLESLLKLATKLGAKVLTGSKVESVKGQLVKVSNSDMNVEFSATKIVVCTNAFTMNLFPEVNLSPGRGQVLITKPIKNLKFKGTFHMEEGYYYFRNVGDRVLFGGGRHLDKQVEETTKHGINPLIEENLLSVLNTDLLPNQDFEIDHQWSGIMAFGDVKKPILKWVNEHTFLAVRLGGMGMALGSELGELASKAILK